jgi:hypothetical protein
MIAKLKRASKRALVKFIRAREERAAHDLAVYLKRYNSDFRNCSQYDLAKAIMSKKPLNLNQISW